MAKVTAVGQIKQALSGYADSVGKNKAGNIVVRRGYFYRSGTADGFSASVVAACKANGINVNVVEVKDVWKPFRGSASIANSSHFYVELSVGV